MHVLANYTCKLLIQLKLDELHQDTNQATPDTAHKS